MSAESVKEPDTHRKCRWLSLSLREVKFRQQRARITALLARNMNRDVPYQRVIREVYQGELEVKWPNKTLRTVITYTRRQLPGHRLAYRR